MKLKASLWAGSTVISGVGGILKEGELSRGTGLSVGNYTSGSSGGYDWRREERTLDYLA